MAWLEPPGGGTAAGPAWRPKLTGGGPTGSFLPAARLVDGTAPGLPRPHHHDRDPGREPRTPPLAGARGLAQASQGP